MRDLAGKTGGQAFVDTNAVGQAVAAAISDGASYYTLGYVPSNTKYDGKFRKIDVHVEGPHDELEFRHEYFADDPNKPQTSIPSLSLLTSAMAYGVPTLAQIRFDVRVLPAGDPGLQGEKISPEPAGAMAKDMKGPLRREVVDYWIDPRDMDYGALRDGRRLRELEITQAVYNSDGQRLNYSDQGLEVALTPEHETRALSEGMRVHQEIDVPAGNIYLRLGVEDKLSGRIGTVEISLAGGKADSRQ